MPKLPLSNNLNLDNFALYFINIYTNNFKPELPQNYSKLQSQLAQIALDSSVSWHENALTPCCQTDYPTCFAPLSNQANMPLAQQIRAGFFVNWDPQSYFSLRNNIDKINMVLPEWFFLSDADTVVFKPDIRAFKLLRDNPSVAVVPLLSNFWADQWHSDNVERLFKNPTKRDIFIKSLVNTLKKYGFKGVNVDFEGLADTTTEDFYAFISILHTRLNTEGLLLSQSIVPLNFHYKPERLEPITDLLFVMAYNQHYQTGKAGSIADQKWVEGIMDLVSKNLPKNKFVLSIADYGLNWGKQGTDAQPITYRGALSIAKEASAKITFNPTTYNLEFAYTDDEQVPHKVFFVDAVTNFNQIRAATNFGWRGVALWRIGAEDPRLWQFYNKDLSNNCLEKGSFDLKSLKQPLLPKMWIMWAKVK